MTAQITQAETIEAINASLSKVDLPTYTELQAALADLQANSWLDHDPSENEYLGMAKERARKAYAASKGSVNVPTLGQHMKNPSDVNTPEAPKTVADAPRVLVIVTGGVAETVSDDGVDVEVFDWDNYKADPERTGGVPTHFADLAAPLGIPVEEENQAEDDDFPVPF